MTRSFWTTAMASPGRCHAAIVSRTFFSSMASLSWADAVRAIRKTLTAMTKRRMRVILFVMRRTASALLVLLMLSCAGITIYEQQEMDTLYFGTQKPDGPPPVTETEWQRFLGGGKTTQFPGRRAHGGRPRARRAGAGA